MVTSANDNVRYHFVELNETRIATSAVGKRIKALKKWHDAEPDPTLETKGDISDEED